MKLVLAGDVGGTKANLAFYPWELSPGPGLPGGDRLRPPAPVAEARFSSQDAAGLGAIALQFCKDSGLRPDVACFGIAGPVIGGHVRAPNIPWEVSDVELAAQLNVPSVRLINDLEAAAYGVACLAPAQLRTLQNGNYQSGASAAVIAAGTGLGEAMLTSVAGRRVALASEGGHADFAPADPEQIELLKYLMDTHSQVSNERILAGPGIVRLYDFVRRAAGPVSPEITARFSNVKDQAAVVSTLALEGDPLAARALRLFVKIYGSAAGSMALRTLPYAGMFVAGGIAPKILKFIEEGAFMEAFLAKGRMARLMPGFPVHVVLEEKTPLLGAAALGATL